MKCGKGLSALMIVAVALSAVTAEIKAFSSCGNGRKVVALTFDDGPWASSGGTAQILKQLAQLMIPGTFFITPAAMGDDDKQLNARCGLIRQQVASGNSVQIHSWDHRKTPKSAPMSVIGDDLRKVQQYLKRCAGVQPTQYRPPFGVITPEQVEYVNRQGLAVAMWNLAPRDTEKKSEDAQVIFERIMTTFRQNIQEGNSVVLLLHDQMMVGRPQLIPMIYKAFTKLGYTFITTEDCYRNCHRAVCSGNGAPEKGSGMFIPSNVQ